MSIALSSVLRMVDGKPGHLLHYCRGCECGHVIDIHAISQDGRVTGWDGTFEHPTIGEPLRHVNESGLICEYTLKAGVQHFLESCTAHGLAGQSRRLVDIPHTCRPENSLLCLTIDCPRRKTS